MRTTRSGRRMWTAFYGGGGYAHLRAPGFPPDGSDGLVTGLDSLDLRWVLYGDGVKILALD